MLVPLNWVLNISSTQRTTTAILELNFDFFKPLILCNAKGEVIHWDIHDHSSKTVELWLCNLNYPIAQLET